MPSWIISLVKLWHFVSVFIEERYLLLCLNLGSSFYNEIDILWSRSFSSQTNTLLHQYCVTLNLNICDIWLLHWELSSFVVNICGLLLNHVIKKLTRNIVTFYVLINFNINVVSCTISYFVLLFASWNLFGLVIKYSCFVQG